MSETEEDLSVKHLNVIDYYYENGQDWLKAYRAVYTKANENSARTESAKLFKKLAKTSYFSEKLSKAKKIAEEKFQINREWLLEQHKKVYESAMEGDEILTEHGSYTKLDRSAANKSLDQLCKMVGEYADVKAKLQVEGAGKNGSIKVDIAHQLGKLNDEQLIQLAEIAEIIEKKN